MTFADNNDMWVRGKHHTVTTTTIAITTTTTSWVAITKNLQRVRHAAGTHGFCQSVQLRHIWGVLS